MNRALEKIGIDDDWFSFFAALRVLRQVEW